MEIDPVNASTVDMVAYIGYKKNVIMKLILMNNH